MKFNFSSTKSQKQIAINAFSNILIYGINLGIGLWFTSYLINKLGIESYGLIPLALSVSSYLSIITLALNGAIGRYLTIDLHHNDLQAANKTFNTSFFGTIIISVVFFPLIALIAFLIPHIFNVPKGDEFSAILLFFLVLISFFITTIASCFSVSSWAKNRFDLKNIVVFFSNFGRVLSITFLFKMHNPSVWIVGIGFLEIG